jgi:hypothetical protein
MFAGICTWRPQERLESGHRRFPAIETQNEFIEASLPTMMMNGATLVKCIGI